ncbi:MAG: pyridoxamine 5'-phosphate oxidase family protein [Algoriphagus sp.]|nr:pyridoxamine 5'-phosphate oxidase family protein [Algoriphagus sp.]
MNSITSTQKEGNHTNLMGEEAIKKMRNLIDKSGSCFFCTSTLMNKINSSPMSVQKSDMNGDLWFLSPKDSIKNMEITQDSEVTLYFQGSPHSDFLELKGKATISDDKDLIKELWDPMAKSWFKEGKDDPRISVIQFKTESGYYWDNEHGNTIAGIKLLIGVITGTSTDDSEEGSLKI